MFWPCESTTSTRRNFATISSGVYRFFGIAVLLHVKRHSSGRTTSKGEDHSGMLALLAIVSSVFFANRKKAVTVQPQRTSSEIKLANFTGQSYAPPTKPSDPDS